MKFPIYNGERYLGVLSSHILQTSRHSVGGVVNISLNNFTFPGYFSRPPTQTGLTWVLRPIITRNLLACQESEPMTRQSVSSVLAIAALACLPPNMTKISRAGCQHSLNSYWGSAENNLRAIVVSVNYQELGDESEVRQTVDLLPVSCFIDCWLL